MEITPDYQHSKQTKEVEEFTFDEISMCPQKNWEFWTECARFSLKCYREHKRDNGRDYGFTRSHKVDFKERLQKRREQIHLNKDRSK